jgi:excisionase family DNA binding protein
MPELMNLKEGADVLRLSIHTVRAWIYQGRLPYVRLGRRVLLRREDLEILIQKGFQSPATKAQR